MSDPFATYLPGLESPASHAFDITPDDATDLPFFPRGLSVLTEGQVRVTTLSGDEATIHVLPGAPFPIRCRRVWATGTTVTGLVGLY